MLKILFPEFSFFVLTGPSSLLSSMPSGNTTVSQSLKKPFDLLNENDLVPYKVIQKSMVENAEIIKSLGTEDYLQWTLEDTSVPKASPVRICSVFITYYGLSDKIPHVPEECYIGGGYQQELSDSVVFKINKVSGVEEIPGKYLIFSNPNVDFLAGGSKFCVLYTFNVNGVYANDRASVRIILMKNLMSKYSYFSKIELGFKYGRPTKDDVIKASEKLLTVLLPLLEDQHWPDLKK